MVDQSAFNAYRKWLGIPENEQPPNHYRLLGIPLLEDDLDVIANAAERQANYVRTFRLGAHVSECERLMGEIAAARACLLDPEKKAVYDRSLQAPPALDVGPRPGPILTPRTEQRRLRKTRSLRGEVIQVAVGGIAGLAIGYAILHYALGIDLLRLFGGRAPEIAIQDQLQPPTPEPQTAPSPAASAPSPTPPAAPSVAHSRDVPDDSQNTLPATDIPRPAEPPQSSEPGSDQVTSPEPNTGLSPFAINVPSSDSDIAITTPATDDNDFSRPAIEPNSPADVKWNPSAPDPRLVRFEPIMMNYGQGRTSQGVMASLKGCIAAGSAADVAWDANTLYMGRRSPIWQLIWHQPQPNFVLTSVSFDGRYLWGAATRHPLPPGVFAIDVGGGRSWELTTGLEFTESSEAQMNRGLMLSAISTGKALIAAHEEKRTWLARVELTPRRGISVNVFHRAEDPDDASKAEQWKSTTVAFMPGFVFTLTEDGAAEDDPKAAIIVGRVAAGDVVNHPLVVDPTTLEIQVHQHGLWSQVDPRALDLVDGSLYFSGPGESGTLDLRGVRYPGVTSEVVARNIPEGWIRVLGDRAHVVGPHWWSIGLDSGKVDVLARRVGWLYRPMYFSTREYVEHSAREWVVKPDDLQMDTLIRTQHHGILVGCFTSNGGRQYLRVHLEGIPPE